MNIAAVERPLPLSARPELEFCAVDVRGQRRWNVKDPVALRYFQIRDEEHFLLKLLRKTQSLSTIRQAFEARFAPRRVAVLELQAFLGALHQEGLIVSDAPGQAAHLQTQQRKGAGREWRSRLTNLLAIRFRGVNADGWLDRIYPWFAWMFSIWFAAAASLFVLAVVAFAVLHFPELQIRLPAFQTLFTAKTIFWFAVALAGSKVLHELGHGLACKHVGGECHEMGLMLLVGTPCLYCNVSDIWMESNKWRRVLVSAAGIWVDILLAAVAFVIWWNSQAGFLNSVCFSLMIVGSVSSLLFNGNPLLRYDAYYVLADILEAPNLAGQSGEFLRRCAAKWSLGLEPPQDVLGDFQRWPLLLSYGVAAILFRFFVTVVILWVVFRAAAVFRVEFLAVVLSAIVIVGLAAPLFSRGLKFFQRPDSWRRFRPENLLATGLLLAALGAAAVYLPLPHRIAAPALIQAKDSEPIYVQAAGELVEAARPGQLVAAGETLALLHNHDLALSLATIQGQRNSQVLHCENLKKRSLFDESLEAEIPSAMERQDDLAKQLLEKQKQVAKLKIVAPQAGVVLPAPQRVSQPGLSELTSWAGLPTDPDNLGCLLERGDMLCRLGDPKRLEALLVLPQSEIQFVAPGQRVVIQLAMLGGQFIEGRVQEIAEADLQQAPPELIEAGELAATNSSDDGPEPATTSYLVRVQLEPGEHEIVLRATGQARVYATPRTAWQRIAHFLSRTFGFESVVLTP